MSILEIIKRRVSVRDYLDRPVEREKIIRCLEAARLAPSACNAQPWKFIVKVSWLKLGGYLRNTRYYLIDLGIAGEHLILQAAELGLATCWIGWFDEKAVKKVLDIPKNKKVDIMISVGYPKEEEFSSKERYPLEEISSFNRY